MTTANERIQIRHKAVMETKDAMLATLRSEIESHEEKNEKLKSKYERQLITIDEYIHQTSINKYTILTLSKIIRTI